MNFRKGSPRSGENEDSHLYHYYKCPDTVLDFLTRYLGFRHNIWISDMVCGFLAQYLDVCSGAWMSGAVSGCLEWYLDVWCGT